jgi:hypothetical protein
MKAGLFSLLALASGSACYAELPSREAVSGTYLLQFSQEARASLRVAGMPEPAVRLRLAKDLTFEFHRVMAGVSTRATGEYKLRDGGIVLLFDGESPMGAERVEGSLQDSSLSLGGLNYVREREAPRTPAMVGTWTLRRDGFEDRNTRLIFNEDGTFRFKMSNATSCGKFQIQEGRLVLLWTEVDGESIELGTMRKSVRLAEDGSFKIDTFRYQKVE